MLIRILFVLACLSPAMIYSQEETQLPVAEEEKPPLDCSRESLLSFFPKPIVFKVLKTYQVPKDKWDAIYQALEQKDKNIIRMVEEKAAQMDPNPLKDLKHRGQAVKLFRETLTESFSSVMKSNGIESESEIEQMLQDIQIEKAKSFAECMERER